MTTKDLHEWCLDESNHPSDEMYYKGALWSQVMFVRDTLAPRLKCKATVIGTHHSKSIECPAYRLETEWAIITMRYNFYDWNITVESKVGPLEYIPELEGMYHYCFMQGMPLKLPAYTADNRERFTAYVGHHYELFAILWWMSCAQED